MKHKELFLAVFISIISYLVFFHKTLNPNLLIYSGSDSVRLHYQSRSYIYDSLHNGIFPFWTERMLMGYPFYADMERGALNIFNIALIYLSGPVLSYKITHFLFYLVGSVSFYFLLKKHGSNILGFAVANLIYFFSTFMIFHQQHFNIILAAYLLPAMVLLLYNYINARKKVLWMIFYCLVFTQTFYFGAFQILLLNTLVSLIYILIYSEKINKDGSPRHVLKKLFYLYGFCFALILPGLIPQAELYLSSVRITNSVYSLGSLKIFGFLNLFYPFLFGKSAEYTGMSINSEYFIHEIYVYLGISTVIFYIFLVLPYLEGKDRKFSNTLILGATFLMVWGLLPVVNKIPLFPFSIFRYWVRASYVLSFAVSFGLASLFTHGFSQEKKTNLDFIIEYISWIIFFGVIQLILYKNEFNETIKYFIKDLTSIKVDNLVWVSVLVFSIAVLLFRKILGRYFKYAAGTLIILDTVYFGMSSSYNLFKNKSEISYQSKYSEVKHERIFDFTGNNNSSTVLLNGYWNILGYAELAPLSTVNKLVKIGLRSQKDAEFYNDNTGGMEKLMDLKALGVSKIILNDGRIISLQNNILDTKNLSNIVVREGSIKAKVTSSPITVNTKISYFPGWALFVNKSRYVGMTTDMDGFLVLNLPKSTSEFKLVYIPIHLYIGLFCSAVAGFLLFLYGRKNQKEHF